jgi:hypothetical protein
VAFPRLRREFDSPHPLQILASLMACFFNGQRFIRHLGKMILLNLGESLERWLEELDDRLLEEYILKKK